MYWTAGGTAARAWSWPFTASNAEVEDEWSYTSTTLYAFTTCTLYSSVTADHVRQGRAVKFTLRPISPISPSTTGTVRHTYANFFWWSTLFYGVGHKIFMLVKPRLLKIMKKGKLGAEGLCVCVVINRYWLRAPSVYWLPHTHTVSSTDRPC